MNQADYTSNITANTTAKEAIDKIGRVSEWWATDFEGSARKVGDTFKLRFGETFVDFRIVEAVADKKIVWQVTDCYLAWLKDKTEWTGTHIAWDVSSTNGCVNVSMTHTGLVPGIECYERCKEGWDFYMAKSLRQFLAEGKGLPEEGAGKKKGPGLNQTT